MLAGAFAVVIVVCGVLLVLDLTGSDGADGDGEQTVAADDATTRELVMSQANQFVLRVNTYGPGDLDEQNLMPEYAERVREVITPKLAAGFDQNVTLAEQAVSGAGYARGVELSATGVESLGDDTASVLVAGSISGSYPDPQKEGRIEVEPRPFRFRVTLVRTEGQWLVDDQVAVTGLPGDQPGLGEPAPTTPPAGAPGEGAEQ